MPRLPAFADTYVCALCGRYGSYDELCDPLPVEFTR
jgi:hypothetical protein